MSILQKKCETIAEHSFSVALLAMSLIQKNNLPYDLLKCLKMSIIHDLGEIYTGDYTPLDTCTKQEKHKQEEEAIKKVLSNLDFDHDFLEIWKEYEMRETKEAKFIYNVDKVEFLLQATSYGFDIQYFKKSLSQINDKYCKEIANELLILTKGKKEPTIKEKKNG